MIRPVQCGDLDQAPELLARAFSGYRDALLYDAEVLELFRRLWWTPLSGVVADVDGRLVGMAMVGLRAARFDGRALTVAHVGPVAVAPQFQGHGLGSAMMAALEPQADLLTLTTNDAENIRGFYEDRGYGVVCRFQPQVRDLRSRPLDMPTSATGGDRAVVEAHQEAGRPFHHGAARVRAIQWPVTSRRSGRIETLRTCQLLAREGEGPDLAAALDDACTWARMSRCELIWGEPRVTQGLPGFTTGAGAGVSRLVRPISPIGEQVAMKARAWEGSGPSP